MSPLGQPNTVNMFTATKNSKKIHDPHNLPRDLAKVAVSSSFFLLTICFFFHMLYRISTKLGHKHLWVHGYKSYGLFDLKGHVGVTGVKKVIFTKTATPLTN